MHETHEVSPTSQTYKDAKHTKHHEDQKQIRVISVLFGRRSRESLTSLSSCFLNVVQHFMDRFDRIGLLDGLVLAEPQDPRKANGHAGLMSRRFLNRLECDLENQLRLHTADRTERLDSIRPNETIDDPDLSVGQSRVSFCKRHKLAVAPDGKRVIGKKVRSFAAAFLRVDEDDVDG